jgi:hypothetical protein
LFPEGKKDAAQYFCLTPGAFPVFGVPWNAAAATWFMKAVRNKYAQSPFHPLRSQAFNNNIF